MREVILEKDFTDNYEDICVEFGLCSTQTVEWNIDKECLVILYQDYLGDWWHKEIHYGDKLELVEATDGYKSLIFDVVEFVKTREDGGTFVSAHFDVDEDYLSDYWFVED